MFYTSTDGVGPPTQKGCALNPDCDLPDHLRASWEVRAETIAVLLRSSSARLMTSKREVTIWIQDTALLS